MKYGRRECEACERRLTNLRPSGDTRGLVGDCAEHGTVPAWITGVRQNRIDELTDQLARAVGPALGRLSAERVTVR